MRRKTRHSKKKKHSSLLRKYGPFLHGVGHAPPQLRKMIIQKCPKGAIDCVGECCLNIIKGKVRLTKAQKDRLRKRKNHLRLLSSKQVSVASKKRIINQKGGILPLLLKPLLVPLIGSVIGGLAQGIKK